MFDKFKLKLILNNQIDIFIIINYNYDKWDQSSNSGGCEIIKDIVEIIGAN